MSSTSYKFSLRVASAALVFAAAPTLWANHPVVLEGNCNVPPAGNSVAATGVCGDWDGDGVIGVDEDNDGDRVFGTFAGANGAAGANNNGTITIVTSGVFAEPMSLTGNITVQAAPGVEANFDAVLQGDAGSGARMGMSGVTINAASSRFVVLRNLTIRNWTTGIQVIGDSKVLIDNCKVEHNTNYGIWASGNSSVLVDSSTVIATGRRVNPGTGDYPSGMAPLPGNGIEFSDMATGAVVGSTVTGSVGNGITTPSGKGFTVGPDLRQKNTVFGNGRDFSVK
jgi:hypothetical protein